MADSFVDFSVRFLVPFLRSIFAPFFGLFSPRDLLVSKGFLDFGGGFRPVLGPLLGRTFEHDFGILGLLFSPSGGSCL